MKIYLLPQGGNFYKANLHTHTTISDGMLTPEEVKALYKKYGYSIVAYTDHEVFIPHNDLTDADFLALNGFEAAFRADELTRFGVRKTAHICFIAKDAGQTLQPCWHRDPERYPSGKCAKSKHLVKFDESEPDYERTYSGEGVSTYTRLVKEKGFFATYNHPGWSCEDFGDYMNYHNMDAMEMFNGGCIVQGYDDYNAKVYDDMLRGGERLYCLGTDDNHNKKPEGTRDFDSGYSFTMIKAGALDYPTVMNALQNGHFYASEGPEIKDLYVEDGRLHVKCSPADSIRCNYAIRKAGIKAAEGGALVTEAVFELPENYGYLRVTVTDEHGKHACTNAYFADQIG